MTAHFLDITSRIATVVTSSSEPRRLLLLLCVVADLDNAVRVSDDLLVEQSALPAVGSLRRGRTSEEL
jgi:hypothetical protein